VLVHQHPVLEKLAKNFGRMAAGMHAIIARHSSMNSHDLALEFIM